MPDVEPPLWGPPTPRRVDRRGGGARGKTSSLREVPDRAPVEVGVWPGTPRLWTHQPWSSPGSTTRHARVGCSTAAPHPDARTWVPGGGGGRPAVSATEHRG